MGSALHSDPGSVPANQRLLLLPDPPSNLQTAVKAWRQPVTLLTYLPDSPSRHPMFLEKRVYQGSSGKVYPLPFTDRIATEPVERSWDAIHLENEFIRLMILPQIGGRIHVGYDKINGYDFFYHQNVIKPALVGLAGPWISGGVEFNWPQHHRPATFMPVETSIEEGADGSVTVWCSDHDPMLHLKGMHGVCLHPGRAVIELKVRLYNRTQFTQTFLWWANVAARVHEKYQSFFPPDVRFVADHAKRAITAFPLSDRHYYGVDYAGRAANGVPADEVPSHFRPDGCYEPNDLSWYANIPVPTSYMITASQGDFFGGYDHRQDAGFVHIANHHIVPGKKQWTWGNHDFGYAWDCNLTDGDGPYIELMAGAYTDNQPDFSWLAPWETKTFSQFWYPIRKLGVPQAASLDAAVRLDVRNGLIYAGVCVTRNFSQASIRILRKGEVVHEWNEDLRIEHTVQHSIAQPPETAPGEFSIAVFAEGKQLLAYDPAKIVSAEPPSIAKEPPAPGEVRTQEELFLIGIHLAQYRHATRFPELYWQEALRRDPADSRCNNALGLWHLRRGELDAAIECFRVAIERLTQLNPNPYDGEPYYNLGVALRLQEKTEQAYAAFYKTTWNAAWRGPAYFALAEIDAARGHWAEAEDHLRRALTADGDNLNARNLLAYVLRRQNRTVEAETLLDQTLATDPLDIGARWMRGSAPGSAQEILDLAFDLLRSGRDRGAAELLDGKNAAPCGPMIGFLLADIQAQTGDSAETSTFARIGKLPRGACFPSRIEELLLLERTIARHPDCALAYDLAGCLLYHLRRYPEAIVSWERSVTIEPENPTVWRNLGIAYFNVRQNPDAALKAYDRAFALDQTDGRVLYERDQLWKRTRRAPHERLKVLASHPELAQERDDLSIEVATLHNQLGQPLRALEIIEQRSFQPWEGGEGLVLNQYVRAHLLLGYEWLAKANHAEALMHFKAALETPKNLGEAKHLLANQSNIYYALGRVHEESGNTEEAAAWWKRAASQHGDFLQMSVRSTSEMSFWRGLALEELGQHTLADETFKEMLAFADELERSIPSIDYFATSLPTMLLFDEDLGLRNRMEASFLRSLALIGLRDLVSARGILEKMLADDPNHAGARDTLRYLQATGKAGTL